MKIGFLGICDFGLMYLEHLLEKGMDVKFATSKSVSQPHISDLEKKCEALCKAHNTPYLGNVNANSTQLVELARETDICIMGGYDNILKAPFINAPGLGVTNTHLSIIPRHRGCYPIVWSILCDTTAGFTTYATDTNIDLGIVIDQGGTDIKPDDTAKSLYEKVSALTVDSFKQKFNYIMQWSWPEIPLSKKGACYHTAGMPNDRWISWFWRDEFLVRFSRSLTFPPYPGPRTKLKNCPGDVELFILKTESTIHHDQPGTIVDVEGNKLYVTCGNGVVVCKTGQPGMITHIEAGMVFESMSGKIHPIPLHYDKSFLFM